MSDESDEVIDEAVESYAGLDSKNLVATARPIEELDKNDDDDNNDDEDHDDGPSNGRYADNDDDLNFTESIVTGEQHTPKGLLAPVFPELSQTPFTSRRPTQTPAQPHLSGLMVSTDDDGEESDALAKEMFKEGHEIMIDVSGPALGDAEIFYPPSAATALSAEDSEDSMEKYQLTLQPDAYNVAVGSERLEVPLWHGMPFTKTLKLKSGLVQLRIYDENSMAKHGSVVSGASIERIDGFDEFLRTQSSFSTALLGNNSRSSTEQLPDLICNYLASGTVPLVTSACGELSTALDSKDLSEAVSSVVLEPRRGTDKKMLLLSMELAEQGNASLGVSLLECLQKMMLCVPATLRRCVAHNILTYECKNVLSRLRESPDVLRAYQALHLEAMAVPGAVQDVAAEEECVSALDIISSTTLLDQEVTCVLDAVLHWIWTFGYVSPDVVAPRALNVLFDLFHVDGSHKPKISCTDLCKIIDVLRRQIVTSSSIEKWEDRLLLLHYILRSFEEHNSKHCLTHQSVIDMIPLVTFGDNVPLPARLVLFAMLMDQHKDAVLTHPAFVQFVVGIFTNASMNASQDATTSDSALDLLVQLVSTPLGGALTLNQFGPQLLSAAYNQLIAEAYLKLLTALYTHHRQALVATLCHQDTDESVRNWIFQKAQSGDKQAVAIVDSLTCMCPSDAVSSFLKRPIGRDWVGCLVALCRAAHGDMNFGRTAQRLTELADFARRPAVSVSLTEADWGCMASLILSDSSSSLDVYCDPHVTSAASHLCSTVLTGAFVHVQELLGPMKALLRRSMEGRNTHKHLGDAGYELVRLWDLRLNHVDTMEQTRTQAEGDIARLKQQVMELVQSSSDLSMQLKKSHVVVEDLTQRLESSAPKTELDDALRKLKGVEDRNADMSQQLAEATRAWEALSSFSSALVLDVEAQSRASLFELCTSAMETMFSVCANEALRSHLLHERSVVFSEGLIYDAVQMLGDGLEAEHHVLVSSLRDQHRSDLIVDGLRRRLSRPSALRGGAAAATSPTSSQVKKEVRSVGVTASEHMIVEEPVGTQRAARSHPYQSPPRPHQVEGNEETSPSCTIPRGGIQCGMCFLKGRLCHGHNNSAIPPPTSPARTHVDAAAAGALSPINSSSSRSLPPPPSLIAGLKPSRGTGTRISREVLMQRNIFRV